MKDVPDLCSVQRHGEKPKLCYCKCPNTAKSHQPMGTARGTPLKILEKRHESSQKQPVKMEGDNISNDLVHVASRQGDQTFTGLQQLVELLNY